MTRMRQAIFGTGLDREPVAREIPGELGREGATETGVGRRRTEDLARRRTAIDRASPDAEVGAAGAIDPHLVDERAGWVDRGAADDVALIGDRPGAAACNVDRLDARRGAVIGPDEDDAPERAGRERLRGEDHGPDDPLAVEPEDEPLARERSRVIEDRVQPEPGLPTQVGGRCRDLVTRRCDPLCSAAPRRRSAPTVGRPLRASWMR